MSVDRNGMNILFFIGLGAKTNNHLQEKQRSSTSDSLSISKVVNAVLARRIKAIHRVYLIVVFILLSYPFAGRTFKWHHRIMVRTEKDFFEIQSASFCKSMSFMPSRLSASLRGPSLPTFQPTIVAFVHHKPKRSCLAAKACCVQTFQTVGSSSRINSSRDNISGMMSEQISVIRKKKPREKHSRRRRKSSGNDRFNDYHITSRWRPLLHRNVSTSASPGTLRHNTQLYPH